MAQLYDLDLLHVHYAIPHSVSAMLARQMLASGPRGRRLPFVTTLHGTDITLVGLDRSYLGITRYSIEQSDGVTAISNYLRDRTQRVFDVKNKIEVIYNSVNCDVYYRNTEIAAEMRREYAPNNQRVLVHLSNFRPVKRLTDVIEIFDRVRKQIPSRLLLIGDGPDRSVAEWLAVQKGIHDDVLFLGKQDQIYEKLSIADIMLLPSELESFGLAALEAMACEVVPISTRAGGVPEVIDHGIERISGGCRRRGDDGAIRHRTAERRTAAARDGKASPRGRDGAFLLDQDREAVRRFLSSRAGALGVEAFRHRACRLDQRQANANQSSLPFVAVDGHARGISIKHLQALGDIRHSDSHPGPTAALFQLRAAHARHRRLRLR